MKLLISQNRKGFVLAITAIVMNSVLNILQASLLGVLFDHLSDIMQPWLLGMVVLYLVLTMTASLYIDFAKESLKKNIRGFLLKNGIRAYMNMDELAFEKKETSVYINEMTTEVDMVIDQYVTPLLNTFALITSFVLGSVYFLFLDWRMLLFLYAGSLVTLAINRICQARLARNQQSILETKNEWICTLQSFFSNFSAIKDFGLEEKETEVLERAGMHNVKAYYKAGIELANLDSIDLEIGFALFFGLIVLCGTLFSGTISAGIAITAVQLTNNIVNPIINFTTIWNRLNASKPVLERLLSMGKDRQEKTAEEIDEVVDTIEVDAPLIQAGDAKLLHDIHLRFEKGGKYMITGPSGCGKTTLIRTLKGTIPSACVRLNDRSGKSMKEQLCVIGQKTSLFPCTLAQNIALNKPIGKKEIERLLARVHLSHLDPDRPVRLDHDTMSGGERQRVLLARVMAQNRPWIFLDEAFSALDHETTRLLEREYVTDPALSVVSICHKPVLENIQYYDQIIVMEKGTVKKVMTPEEWIHSLS